MEIEELEEELEFLQRKLKAAEVEFDFLDCVYDHSPNEELAQAYQKMNDAADRVGEIEDEICDVKIELARLRREKYGK
jgi:hypothetical protein